MEHNYSIPKTKHIHKPITGLLFTVALLLFTAIINPLTVHAADINVGVEAENSDGTYSSSGGKWYATYCTSAGYKGQGVLIYLLERNGGGAVAGTTPKAFPCSARMKTYELHAQDKYNRYDEVTTWEQTYPRWTSRTSQSPVTNNSGGFMKDSVTSNVQAIKAWLKTPLNINGVETTQGIQMVYDIWEAECPGITDRFANEEIILIAEPIVAVQFSQYYKSGVLDIDETMSANTIKYRLISFLTYIDRNDDTSMSKDLDELVNRSISNLNLIISGRIPSGSAVQSCIKGICKDLKQLVTSTNIYRPLGNTYAGTSKMVAQYYESLTPNRTVLHWYKSDSGRSYYRRSASASAYIPEGSFICANANFNLLPASIPARQIHPTYNLQTYSIGMLAMLAWHDDTTTGDVQTTCDESLIPTEHGAPDESTGNCVIIKTYRERINGVITADKGTYYRYDVCPNITIEDEGFANNCYRVIAWRETTSLARNGIDAFNWETSVPGRIGQSGDSSGSVTLNNSNGYKYLYVLLERSSTDTESNYTITEAEIARGIRLTKPDRVTADDNALVDISTFQFKWSRGWLSDSCTHYHNDHQCSRTAFTCSNRSTHSHCNSDCHYNKSMGNYDDHSNGCTGEGTCIEGCHYGKSKGNYTDHNSNYTDYQCNGHSCSGYAWSDYTITLSLLNSKKNDFPNILATKSGWDSIITSLTSNNRWSSTVSFPSASYSNGHNTAYYSSMDMLGVIHRGQDKLTIAKWKNEAADNTAITDLQDISTAGYRVANTPLNVSSNSRKTAPYEDRFTIQIDNGSSTEELKVAIQAANKAETQSVGCTKTQNYRLKLPSESSERQATATVRIKAYSGDVNGGYVDNSFDNSEMITTGSSGNVVKSGRMIRLDGSTVTTYPYIQMHYYNRNGVALDGSRLTSTRKTAYVLGEYQRSFMLNAYAEIEWKKSDTANVELESLQWSTHAEVENDGFEFGEVLPGGATLNLTIPDANRQEVTIRTYNPILAGAGKAQVEATNGTIPDALDFEKAKEAHGDFVLSTIDGLSSLTFRQWYLDENITKKTEAKVGNLWDDSVEGYEVWANMTSPIKTSKDKKYYFTPITSITDGKLATEGDLDADVYSYVTNTSVGIKGQSDKINAIYNNSKVTYATFWVDPKGSIRMATGSDLDVVSNTPKSNPYAGTEIAYRIGNVTQWVSGSSGIVSTAREIDEKTLIITKLTLAFEKGGGNDNTAATAGADAAWYNEAFDGVTYAIVETKVMVGFADPGERSTVLDPVLCPAIEDGKGQTGMFSKYNTAQFKLMNTTNDYTEEYLIGQYRGQDIKMNEFDYLFYSDKFWIPNVTVQDLK